MSRDGPRIARGVDLALECTVVGSFSRLGFSVRRELFGWDDVARASGWGRTVVVTGSTGGLGLAAASQLAARGARVVLLGRSSAELERVRSQILEEQALRRRRRADRRPDLPRVGATRRGASRDARGRVDGLIHNAGALVGERTITEDGLELTAQVHVVAPFLLTALLRPLLRAAGDPRVIFVSSGGMYTSHLDVGALDQPPHPFSGVRDLRQRQARPGGAGRALVRHEAGQGISFFAMHPGWADTPGIHEALPRFSRVMQPLLRTAGEGADTMTWLALDPAASPSRGSIWLDRRPRHATVLPRTRTSPSEAEELWSYCVEHSGTAAEVAP